MKKDLKKYKIKQRKDEQKKQEDKLYLTLHNLGPPNFISSKFRNKTVSKFNCVSGDYFGIPV